MQNSSEEIRNASQRGHVRLIVAVLVGVCVLAIVAIWNREPLRSETQAGASSKSAPAAVSSRDTRTIDSSRRNAIVRAVETVAPAVVTVHTLDIQYERVVSPFFRDFFGLFDVPGRRFIRERPVQAIGSGFVFDPHGYILTNVHVIQGADEIFVTLPDERSFKAAIVGIDPRSDIAVLKIDGEDLPYTRLGDSNDLMIGEWVIALGNPFGMYVRDRQPSVSVGVVSANHRRISPSVGGGERFYQDMIQTDAAINPGNSGGPLVNAAGDVVGVNTFIFSQSGGSIGLGFAIPANRVVRIVDELIAHKRRLNTWPGFRAVWRDNGALVVEILKSSPAYEAGLRPGDVIIGFDGDRVAQLRDLEMALWGTFVGDEVAIRVQRQERTLTIRFPIVEIERPR